MICSITIFANNKETKTDSLNKIIKKYEVTLASKNDSLRNKLIIYQAKEDYYATALSDQATRFSLIVASIVGLFALVSFAGFKNEVSKIKKDSEKELRKMKIEIAGFEKRITKQEYSLDVAAGNFFALAGETFMTQKKPFLAFTFYLTACRRHCLAYIAVKKDESKSESDEEDMLIYCKANLESAVEALEAIPMEENTKNAFIEQSNDLFEELDTIAETKNSELILSTAEIRIKIKTFIN